MSSSQLPQLPQLPHPRRERWQPLRSGLVNLYRYDYEEFWFEDGRLLLRGNNGTGKSRVLALQLPFLLDGDVSPHRLEPDGDASKKVEWNLLLGNKYPDRLGYTWIEFGRLDASGHEHFTTLGCGLHAAEHRGLVSRWFFITPQRVGKDFHLLTGQRVPLTRERLGEALANIGTIYSTAGDYRKAVDQALFQLGDRYYPLVNLLVQLRQPQLSRHLEEKRLSQVLSEALPPLSESIVADVAESFRSLDDDQSVLASLRGAASGVDTFLKEYIRYLRIAAVRRAAAIRSAQTAFESKRDALRSAREELAITTSHLEATNAEIDRLAVDEESHSATLKTLSDSPEMQNARALDRARELAAERRKEAESARTDLDTAHSRNEEAGRHRHELGKTLADNRSRVEEIAAQIAGRAAAIGIERKTLNAIDDVFQTRWNDEPFRDATRKKAELAVQARFDASNHLRRLNGEVRESEADLARAISEKAQIEGHVTDAIERRRAAHESLESETERLVRACAHWMSTLVELQSFVTDDLSEPLRDWCERAEGVNPVAAGAAEALNEAVKQLAEVISARGRAAADEATAIEGLQSERDRLLAGTHAPPPTPYTRPAESRMIKAGAPFWLLVDFIDEVPDLVKAGIEAALESAGFLDAWVTPDGTLLDIRAGYDDTTLLPSGEPTSGARCLDSVLRPSIDRADPRAATVDENVVRRILQCIPLGGDQGPIWVDLDGTWQMGPLHGSWSKPGAEHIGQSARESARRKRLAEIESELEMRQEVLKNLRNERSVAEQRQRMAAIEARQVPDDGAVRNAVAAIGETTKALDKARSRLAEAEALVATRRSEQQKKRENRDNAAVDLGLTDWIENLRGFDSAVHECRNALSGFWPSLRAYADSRLNHQRAESTSAEAAAEETHRAALNREAQQTAARTAAEFEVLESSIGATVEQILRRISAARDTLKAVQDARKEADRKSRTLEVRVAECNKDVQRLTGEEENAMAARNAACAKLQHMASARLLRIAVPELPETEGAWTLTAALEAARLVARSFTDLDTSELAWAASEKEIHVHIQTLIETLQPHGHRPWYSPEDGVVSVIVNVQGKEWTMAELREDLDGQIRDRQRILDEREREILERHLIGDVSSHLHNLLHQALELVERMNGEIESRPMSTGMALRFNWEVGDEVPAGFDEVRSLLLRKDGTWSSGNRLLLGQFLQQQIRTVRDQHEAGTWLEHLKLALDYRLWHRFVVERQQDGRWQRLTRRTHGTGSGGEKAVALTIPQFAAAAAHYQSAGRFAPRLILLDEAFVGIDNDMRSKCMGLLAAFDLDFIMTSEREWGCYPTLPGLAIYQLSARQGIDAVGVTRWIWNGRQRAVGERLLFDTGVAVIHTAT